jgi:predicted DsbA family dithiol-disulfide isomerase
MIRLDILSDPACPWCYVGKAHLDRALEARPDHPFLIEWHPFQLNPDMAPGGMDRQTYMAMKFGSRDNILRIHEPLIAHAEEAGLPLDLPAITRTPNTFDAHRIIHWAGLEGRQSPMVARLMRAYWAEGQDIGDHATLARLAGEVGFDPDVTLRLLASDADRDLIRSRERHARTRGVNAVPTYILADRHVLQGAQPPALWQQVIDELAGELRETLQ